MTLILIADDEPHVVRVLQRALERAGYRVDAVADGAPALERIRAGHPDILITDIQMPRMSGEALCQRIQEEMPQRRFLIFVLTSRTEVEHRQWSREISNLTFLEKPVSIRKLISTIEGYLQAQHVSGAQ
jgi:two-component system response regulator MprA